MVDQKATDIHWHYGAVQRSDRERLKGHRGFTIWFTGLSAAGKSTLAVATEKALFERGCHTYILDGDNIRHGLNKNLLKVEMDKISMDGLDSDPLSFELSENERKEINKQLRALGYIE